MEVVLLFRLPVAVLEAFKQHVSLTQVHLTGFGTDADLAIIRSVCDRNRYNRLRDRFVQRFVAAELDDLPDILEEVEPFVAAVMTGMPGIFEGVNVGDFTLSLIYEGLRIRPIPRTDVD